MAKSTVVRGTPVRTERMHAGDGAGLSHYDVADALDAKAPHAPAHTEHVGSSATRSQTFLRGEHSHLNSPDGAGGRTMGLGERTAPGADTPVPTRGRQMPHPDIMTKAAEVAGAINFIGDGEGFGSSGVMAGRED